MGKSSARGSDWKICHNPNMFERSTTKFKSHNEQIAFRLSVVGLFCAIQLICKKELEDETTKED